MKRLKNENGFLSLIALLAVVIIISILYYINLTKQAPVVDQPTHEFIKSSGIDTTNYGTTLNSALQQIKNIEKTQAERVEQYPRFPTGTSY